jgi:hydrogenase/urease accessory protein HupE
MSWPPFLLRLESRMGGRVPPPWAGGGRVRGEARRGALRCAAILRTLLFAFLLPLALTPPSYAHELGTIQAYVTFQPGGTWKVDISIDEEHIPPLPATRPAGETRYGPISGLTPEWRARLGIFLSALADRSTLAFDGRPAVPEAISIDRPASPADDPFAPLPKITLHLKGAIPPGAKTATFSTTLPIGSYPLALTNEGDAMPSRRWPQGGPAAETGDPFPLSPRVVPPPLGRVALRYLGLGFQRILPQGTEQILFALGIFLWSRRRKLLFAQIAAFTAGLALASAVAFQGSLQPPLRLVEPAIALSILYLALANLLPRRLQPPPALHVALVALCGLPHGLAFAKTLRDLSPPRSVLATAVLSIDLGALSGLLAVLATAFLLIGSRWNDRSWYRHRVVVPASLALATIGLYWSIERIFLL